MLENCDIIATFSIDGQFRAIWTRSSRAWSVKLLFSLLVAFCLTKAENKTKTSHTIALSKRTDFAKKCWYQQN